MSTWNDFNELAELLAEHLFKGREDSRQASRDIAEAIQELIVSTIEEKTGAV